MLKNVGLGRIGYLKDPIKLSAVLEKVKAHFNMKTVRLALANGKTLGTTIQYIIGQFMSYLI